MRYFKRQTDLQELGPGVVWFEFDGELPVRQVERYSERWYDSRTDYHSELGPGLVDQPPSALGLGPDDEIDASEFERAWAIATAQR